MSLPAEWKAIIKQCIDDGMSDEDVVNYFGRNLDDGPTLMDAATIRSEANRQIAAQTENAGQ